MRYFYKSFIIIIFFIFVKMILRPYLSQIQSNVFMLKKEMCVGSLWYHHSSKFEIGSKSNVIIARYSPGLISVITFSNSGLTSLKCSNTSVEITRSYEHEGQRGKKMGSYTSHSKPFLFRSSASTGPGPQP